MTRDEILSPLYYYTHPDMQSFSTENRLYSIEQTKLVMDSWAKEIATKALLQQGYDDNAANKIVEEILKSNQ